MERDLNSACQKVFETHFTEIKESHTQAEKDLRKVMNQKTANRKGENQRFEALRNAFKLLQKNQL